MKYLKTHIEYNEGIKSGLLKAGLATTLLTTSPNVISQTQQVSNIQLDTFTKSLNNVRELSSIRKEYIKDKELSNILNDIELNIDSKDSTKFIKLFNNLSSHIESKYGYKIETRKIESNFKEDIKSTNLTLIEILGWLGSICLAICGIPQAWQSYKDKNSDGISWGFILLWTFGELFALAYVYDKLDLPLLLNYASNILILSIILYYRINPTRTYKL